jgi:hypothetical protein
MKSREAESFSPNFRPAFNRKLAKWREASYAPLFDIFKSVIYPISKPRLETHVAMISLKELPGGFKIFNVEAVPHSRLSKKDVGMIKDILFAPTRDQDEALCISMHHIVRLDGKNIIIPQMNLFGKYSAPDDIQGDSLYCHLRQTKTIEELNNTAGNS